MLQRFNGNLTLLGGRGEGGGASQGGYNEYEDSYGGGGGMAEAAPKPQRQPAPAQAFDLDDEIPF